MPAPPGQVSGEKVGFLSPIRSPHANHAIERAPSVAIRNRRPGSRKCAFRRLHLSRQADEHILWEPEGLLGISLSRRGVAGFEWKPAGGCQSVAPAGGFARWDTALPTHLCRRRREALLASGCPKFLAIMQAPDLRHHLDPPGVRRLDRPRSRGILRQRQDLPECVQPGLLR
jgi:hypothetical protein